MILASVVFLMSEASKPEGEPSNTLLYVIGSLLAGGLITFFGQLLLRKQTKDKLISEAADEVATAAKSMLEDYRHELAAAREEIAQLRERVAALEAQLADAKADRDRLQAELTQAVEKRAIAQRRVDELESRIDTLEGAVERRRQPGTQP